MTVTTSSRNPGVRKLIEADGEDETKAFVKNHYNIPEHINSWKDIDAYAEKAQRQENMDRKIK